MKNERFEEFAKDCKILGEKEFAGKVVGFNYKKFAELIVKECAQVAFEGDLKRAIGQWGSHSDILKHFEIEHDVVKTFRS